MKIKFTKRCMDMYTAELYSEGDVREFEDARALAIIATGYAKKVCECEQNVQEREHFKSAVNQHIAQKMKEQEKEQKEDKLSDLKKSELIEIAKDMGVSTRGTKEEIIDRILNAQS